MEEELALSAKDQPAISQNSTPKRVVQIVSKKESSISNQQEYLNQHLNRVMKLIEQREHVSGGNKPKTPDSGGSRKKPHRNESRGHSTVIMQDHHEKTKSVKRSTTTFSASQFPLNEDGMNPREEIEAIERGLGRLRIVKSIHTKIMHSSSPSKGDEATPKSPHLATENSSQHGLPGMHPDILAPVGPQDQSFQGLLSSKQKQGFEPEMAGLMLQGQKMSKQQRASIPKRTDKFYKGRVQSRENSCQTTPPRVAEDSQEEVVDDQLPSPKDGNEVCSTQQASSRSPPMLDLQPPEKSSNMRVTMGHSSRASQQ